MNTDNFKCTDKEIEIVKTYRELTSDAKAIIEFGIRNYPKIEQKIKSCTLALVVNNK